MKALGENGLRTLWNNIIMALSSKIDKVTSPTTSILKVTRNGTEVNIDIDNSETIILYCGDAENIN